MNNARIDPKNSFSRWRSAFPGFIPSLLFLLFLCFLFCHKAFINFNYWGIHDWDKHFFFLESPIKTLRDYAQFPLWNPWHCGGMVLFQHCEDSLLSPFTFLYFFLGTPEAAKISLFLHYVLASSGMYLLGRRLFCLRNRIFILVGSCIFLFNGFFALQITVGHYWILTFAYMPFVFYFFETYVQDGKKPDLVLSALSLSFMVFEGGLYPAPFMVLFLFFYSAARCFTLLNFRFMNAFLKLGVLSALFSAVKLVPLWDYMSIYPRITAGIEKIPLSWLRDIFLRTDQRYTLSLFEDQHWLWHEFGCYLGPLLLSLLAIAVVINIISSHRRSLALSLSFCFFVFFLFFLGQYDAHAPYVFLKKLPVFRSQHCLGRFLIALTFIASLMLFHFFSIVETWQRRNPRPRLKAYTDILLFVMAAWIIYNLFCENTATFRDAFTLDPREIDSSQISHECEGKANKNKFCYQASIPGYGSSSADYLGLKLNVAEIMSYEATPPGPGFVMDRPLVFSDQPQAVIDRIHFTPNRISFRLVTPGEAKVFLNQNYVRGWQCNIPGVRVNNENNKPAVVLPKGDYERIEFYYFPGSLWAGVALTFLGIIVAVLFLKTKALN